MRVIELVEEMQLICRRLICNSKAIRLVPTMGSLHSGHASLIKRAIEDEDEEEREERPRESHPLGDNFDREASGQAGGPCRLVPDDRERESSRSSGAPLERHCRGHHVERGGRDRPVVVVSIFINPLQFNDSNDFAKYPVSSELDLKLCEQLGVDFVFMPRGQDILSVDQSVKNDKLRRSSRDHYRQLSGYDACYIKPPDELARDLEGRSRPSHFEGVLTIVCKLLNIVQPSRAYFGEKDYQQLVMVSKMVRDLNMRVKICPVPTVRVEDSMLPLSSRNVRLTEAEKGLAATLMYLALSDAKQSLESKCRYRGEVHSVPANLDTILLGSLLVAQCLIESNEIFQKLEVDPNEIRTDYFELRCARDLTRLNYDETLNLFDCQGGCVRKSIDECRDVSLSARLLMAIWVSQVRLLDNIEVQLNL